jgi:peptidyl-prolyl cis-trans isomerase A (cyclophilin A)
MPNNRDLATSWRRFDPRWLAAISLAICACTGPAGDEPAEGERPAPKADDPAAAPVKNPALLEPFEGTKQAPPEYRVRLKTTQGDVVVAIHRKWAPHGADRFYNLVERNFYDDVALFRAMKGFMVQFGLHGHPRVDSAWQTAPIPDDPVSHSNTRGTITFAMRGANTRTTQVFINYNDNPALDVQGFAPIGEVVEGMDVVEKFYTGYGEGAPKGSGPSQPRIEREGSAYLRKRFPKLDWVQTATVEGN